MSLPSCLLPSWRPASPPISPLTVRCWLSGSEPEVRLSTPFRTHFQSLEQHPLVHQMLKSSLFPEAPWGSYNISFEGGGQVSSGFCCPPRPVPPRNSVVRPQSELFLVWWSSSLLFLSASQSIMYYSLPHVPAFPAGPPLFGLRTSGFRPLPGLRQSGLWPLPGLLSTLLRSSPGLRPTLLWPLPGLFSTLIRPLPDLCPTLLWPLPGLRPTLLWPLPGLFWTLIQPLPGLRPTLLWPLPGLFLTLIRPLPGLRPTLLWPLPGLSSTPLSFFLPPLCTLLIS